MKKTLFKSVLTLTALAVLLAACAVPAASAETADEIGNLLMIAGEDMGNTYFPLVIMVFSANFTQKTIKVISFYFETQITAVAKTGETVSIPMSLLPNCETGEIVKAFENTFGIPIDRYLIYTYTYGSYKPIIDVYDRIFPVTIDIPEEILGTAQYTTINGNMKAIAKASKRDYTPIDKAGLHDLDSVGVLAYFSSIPDRISESGDRFTKAMEDYKYWDAKHAALFNGLRPVVGLMSPDTMAMILQMLFSNQATDMTGEDIAKISAAGLNFAADSGYLTVPGFEGVELQAGDKGSLKGINAYQNMMLAYDSEAIRQQIRAFLYGE